MPCFTCGELGHFAKIVLSVQTVKRKRSTSWLHHVLMTGMVIFLLYFQYFNHLVSGLIWVLIFTCVMTSLLFFLPGAPRFFRRFFRPDGERITCLCSWCWYGRSEVYFGQDRAAEERAACPYYSLESC
jgi:hypothetical protein